jgi:glycosyltransferase involved in cell wall biosynthesis
MRIAIVSEVFLPKIDGVVNRTLNLIRQLPRYGDELLIVCPQARGCDECPVPVLDAPSFSFPLYPEYRIGIPDRRLAAGVKQFAPDVIHFVNPFAFGFRCHDVFRRAGLRTPAVFSFHTLYGEFVKDYRALRPLSKMLWWLTREYHNQADVNLTVSDIMQQDLTSRGFRRVELWPPAVDSELFHPGRRSQAMRQRLSAGWPEKPLLLTVSRLAPEKNVGFLASVMRELPGVRLAVVGDGPERPALERRFAGLDVGFVGYLRGEALAAAYASADAFVYASETETMGNVVLEAMAAGCPVVAPRAGGIPNLIQHDISGFLYLPRDAAEAVRLTRNALEDAALRHRVGRAAREAVEAGNWERSVARVRGVYESAIRRGQAVYRSRDTWQQRLSQMVTFGMVSAFRTFPGEDKLLLARPRVRQDRPRHGYRFTTTGAATCSSLVGPDSPPA